MRVALVILILAVKAAAVPAATYTVRPDGTGDFPTIRQAIAAAVNGDTLLLTDGVFTGMDNRDLDYGGRAICVRSQSGNPEACVIECEGRTSGSVARGFVFASGEGPDSRLEGVTVRNGIATDT